MNIGKHIRDKSGRFQTGSGGRPSGAKNKRKVVSPSEFSNAVATETQTRLDDMLAMASSVVEEKLQDGDLKAALWILQNATGQRSKKLSRTIPGADLSSIDGVVSTAQTVCTMVADGGLGVEEASRFITVLSSYAQLRGYSEINDLRQIVVDFESSQQIRKPTNLPIDIKWGGLSQSSTP